jgi:hypothetical protein
VQVVRRDHVRPALEEEQHLNKKIILFDFGHGTGADFMIFLVKFSSEMCFRKFFS